MPLPGKVIARTPATRRRWIALLPGLLLALIVAGAANALGSVVPLLGPPVISVVIGLGVSLTWRPNALYAPGLRFASRRVLQGSIIVFGLDLSFRQVLSIGIASLPVLVGTLLLALSCAYLLGRRLGLGRDLTTLIGVGTAICGASAIAATDAVIGAAEVDVAYAIATIFAFNVAAVVSFPAVGHLLHLSQHSFGLWAGTAVNDTSSVVAAATTYGHAAATDAVVVKLTRTLAIVPISLALAWWRAARGVDLEGNRCRVAFYRLMPMFIVGFLVAVLINTLGMVPSEWHAQTPRLADWMITLALAAIGLSARTREIRAAGSRPLILGGLLWAIVSLGSLAVQGITRTL